MRFFTLLLCVLFLSSAGAQTVIWGGPGDANGEFDGGLNDWTVNAVSPNENALWVWSEDGFAGQGAYIGTRGPITSPSVNNGAMVFDSDFYDNAGEAGNFGNGLAASPQVGELVSPVFSTEGFDNVSITWHQYMRQFTSTFEIQVTTDGGATWTSYALSENNNVPVNAETSTNSTRILDISDVAANSAEVQFKFVYNADYYFWVIDDVAVIETPDINANLTNMYYPFNAFATPSSMLNADTLQFAAEVVNEGKAEIMSGTITCEILEGANTAYSFSQDFTNLMPGDTAFVVFDDEVLPEDISLAEGLYTVVYEVVSNDGEDFFPGNNGRSEAAEVSSTFFATNDGTGGANSFNSGDFAAVTVMRTGDLPDNMIYKATDILTTGACNGGNGIQNASYEIYAFKVLNQTGEELDPVFAATNFGDPIDEHENLEYAGYSFNTVIAQENYADFSTELFDADDENGIILDENSTYLFAVKWNFEDNPDGLVFVGSSTRIFYYQTATLVYITGDGWFTTVPEDQLAWTVDVTVATEMIENTTLTELEEDAVTVFPNPANTFTNIELNFDEVTDAVIVLRDNKGAFISDKTIENVTNQTVEFQLDNLPSGAYSFEITTTSGKRTVEQFIIAK